MHSLSKLHLHFNKVVWIESGIENLKHLKEISLDVFNLFPNWEISLSEQSEIISEETTIFKLKRWSSVGLKTVILTNYTEFTAAKFLDSLKRYYKSTWTNQGPIMWIMKYVLDDLKTNVSPNDVLSKIGWMNN